MLHAEIKLICAAKAALNVRHLSLIMVRKLEGANKMFGGIRIGGNKMF